MSVLFLGPIYPEKVFSVGVGKISRNPIPHQIEPIHDRPVEPPWNVHYDARPPTLDLTQYD